MATITPLIEMKNIGKRYSGIIALEGINLEVRAGEVTCVLGDNGAGKSTLIKVIGGFHRYDTGSMEFNGEPVRFNSPREALDRGIATVYQDLAVVGLMETWRNFFLGSEISKDIPILRPLDVKAMRSITAAELAKFGVHLTNVNRIVQTLSGGQRQCVAIARAIYFGAKVLVLDEPTAALGVKQSGVVLNYIAQARDAGIAVVFITHNPHHAYLIGDHFAVLKLGEMSLNERREDVTLDQVVQEMAGGDELSALTHQLARSGRIDSSRVRAVSGGGDG